MDLIKWAITPSVLDGFQAEERWSMKTFFTWVVCTVLIYAVMHLIGMAASHYSWEYDFPVVRAFIVSWVAFASAMCMANIEKQAI